MMNRMAYGLARAGWAVLALGTLLVGGVGCGDDGGIPFDGGPMVNLDGDSDIEEIHVAVFGRTFDEGARGLSASDPFSSITEALELRRTTAFYSSADTIVVGTGILSGSGETFPINVPRGVTVRGGSGTIDAARIQLGASPEPAFRLGSGSTLANMQIEVSAEDPSCADEFYHVLVDTGEAGFEQVTIRDVIFEGGTPCHSQIGIGPRASIRIEGRTAFNLANRATAIRSLENTVDTTIEVVGDSRGNCTGVGVLEVGPDQPGMFFRGRNIVSLDSMCFRPGVDEGWQPGQDSEPRTAIQIRGPIDATFAGIEIDSSNGTDNGTFFATGIQHLPEAPLPTTAVTRIIDSDIETTESCIDVNGGTIEIDGRDPGASRDYGSELTRCNHGILRRRGDLKVRNTRMTQHPLSGVLAVGPAEGSIDLGTEDDPGNNTFLNQTPNGEEGDLAVDFDDSVDPPELTTVQAFGNVWTFQVGDQVICRGAQQQETFNIDSRQPGVDVVYNQGDTRQVCPGYQPTGEEDDD